MKIKEAEKLTGLSAKTIRFYENEGLIEVKRNLNSYREYDEKNIKDLKKIKFLRGLDISIAKIKELKSETISLKSLLEDKSKELENQGIDLESKEDIIKSVLKDIDKNNYIDVEKYLEEIEYVETDEYKDMLCELNKLGNRSLSLQLMITLIWGTPFIVLYESISSVNYESIGFKIILSIIATIILTLSWRSYLNQKDKKIRGTIVFILGLILTLILSIGTYMFIVYIQKIIFVPNNYLMYIDKYPYSYIFLFFEIEILAMVIALLYKNIENAEWEWGYYLYNIMKKHVKKIIVLNLVILYVGITGIAVVTQDKIVDYSFYNPFGTEYTYDDITKISTGFAGNENKWYKKRFSKEPGEFYYKVTLNDGKELDFYQAYSEYEDTYLELEVFNKLIMDNKKVEKISSNKNYKLCELDKRYVDRFLRIIEY